MPKAYLIYTEAKKKRGGKCERGKLNLGFRKSRVAKPTWINKTPSYCLEYVLYFTV